MKVQGVEAGKVCTVVPRQEGAWCAQGTASNAPRLGQGPSGMSRPQEAWEEPGLHPTGNGESQRSGYEGTDTWGDQLPGNEVLRRGRLQQVVSTWPLLPTKHGCLPAGLGAERAPPALPPRLPTWEKFLA